MCGKEIFAIPNFITAIRLVSTPPLIYFIYSNRWDFAFYIGSIAVISDFLDGYVARRFNMVSEFGKKFDPTVDKLILIGIFLVFAVKGWHPRWFVLSALVKDLAIPFILLFGFVKGVKLNFSPTKLGKSAVVAQFAFIFLEVFEKYSGVETYNEILYIPTAVLCIASLISYAYLVLKLLRSETRITEN